MSWIQTWKSIGRHIRTSGVTPPLLDGSDDSLNFFQENAREVLGDTWAWATIEGKTGRHFGVGLGGTGARGWAAMAGEIRGTRGLHWGSLVSKTGRPPRAG